MRATWTMYTTIQPNMAMLRSGTMAIFDVSSMGESRSLPCRVGWRRCYGRPRWRAYLIIRERHTAERPQGASALRGLMPAQVIGSHEAREQQ
jgi:hypothetical protein